MAYEYRVAGKSVRLELDPTTVAVRFHDNLPTSGRARATEAVAGMRPFSARYEVPGETLTMVPVKPPSVGGIGPSDAMGALDGQAGVAKAIPVFRVGNNQVMPSDRLILGIKDRSRTQDILAKYKLSSIREDDGEILARTEADADVFALCEKLDAEDAVEFVEPDFITVGRHIPSRPAGTALAGNDPQAQGQYAMAITQAVAAQAIQPGRPEIRIAILDEGVDTGHPDLAAAVVESYDAVEDDSYQDPKPWDGHGTACAGLAAAIAGNGVGIRGTGAGCSIVPVRIAYSAAKGAPWITTTDMIASGIKWAWREAKADILSNSWGGGTASSAIANAFENARTKGRGGLGCVIVIAAGNEFSEVTFPGTLPNVLTVSASNEFDEIKTPSSSDGETWWGTCFGPEVSVAAPGVHNLTTDISGQNGYVVGDYTPNFNGTSSATPIVAGICGLLLSAHPELQESRIRQAICDTADKIGSEPYVDGRNDFAGFGRINALAALNSIR